MRRCRNNMVFIITPTIATIRIQVAGVASILPKSCFLTDRIGVQKTVVMIFIMLPENDETENFWQIIEIPSLGSDHNNPWKKDLILEVMPITLLSDTLHDIRYGFKEVHFDKQEWSI